MISERILKQLQPPQSGERVEINEKLHLFSLRFFQCEITQDKLQFIQELHRYSEQEFQFNHNDSAKYSFRAGYSSVELDIEVHDQIYITPMICYVESDISEDLERLIYMDQWIYAQLKKYGLQV